MSNFEKTRYESQTDDNPHSHNTDGSVDEDAYRRGFQHGAHFAMEAVKEGMPLKRLERWQWAIYKWRFLRTHKKRTPPPIPQAITHKEKLAYNEQIRVEREMWSLRAKLPE